MRVTLSLLLCFLVLLSFCSISLAQTSTDSVTETHLHDIISDTDDHEVAQPTRAPGTATRTDSRMGTSPTPRPTTGIRIPRFFFRGDDMLRSRMTDRPRTTPRDPDTPRRMKRFTMMERRMLMRMFFDLMRLRLRAMMDQYPFGLRRWERRMLREMMFDDLMTMMDVQNEDAIEIAHMIDEQQDIRDMEQTNTENIYDETQTAEPEVEIEEAEPETEVADVEEHEVSDPRDDPRLIDPTLIESEFEISAPYGGYGGGFGGKKKGGYGGYGGGFGGKKGGYGGGYGSKKVPYKKVPYKKVPIKKGPPKKKGGFGGFGYI